MQTKVITIDDSSLHSQKSKLQEIAYFIKRGDLVACPTETVYGLCGNGLDSNSTKKIYEAKGRPSDNPLILHIANFEMLENVAKTVPHKAKKLIDAFWPGALTIILEKQDCVPYETTGGLETVAVRMPSNEIILEIIKLSGLPLAAPSANISGKPSPTKAEHVIEDLSSKIACIVDGGDCKFGVESTIIDCTKDIPVLLRPGSITISMIEKVIGKISVDKSITEKSPVNKPMAPGMKYKHYAPNAKITLVTSDNVKDIPSEIIKLVKKCESNKKIAIICTDETEGLYKDLDVLIFSLGTREDLNTITKKLFHGLRDMDKNNIDIAFCEGFSENEEGLAIMNRLVKASGYNVIKK